MRNKPLWYLRIYDSRMEKYFSSVFAFSGHSVPCRCFRKGPVLAARAWVLLRACKVTPIPGQPPSLTTAHVLQRRFGTPSAGPLLRSDVSLIESAEIYISSLSARDVLIVSPWGFSPCLSHRPFPFTLSLSASFTLSLSVFFQGLLAFQGEV